MSDFSIDYILNRAGEQYIGTNASMGVIERIKLIAAHQTYENIGVISNDVSVGVGSNYPQMLRHNFEQVPVFDWLQYTRYHPPKLQRPMRSMPAKRTPGRLPRIPFTPTQLQALENAYKSSTYLSAEDANKLADSLELTNTRVKIWFQNRRARERRERREKCELVYGDSTLSSGTSSPEPDVIAID